MEEHGGALTLKAERVILTSKISGATNKLQTVETPVTVSIVIFNIQSG